MKIPPQAKKVFSGVIFDIYQWEQEMFDGSYETFEMVKRKPSLSIIATTEDKKIIVLEQEQPDRSPYPSLPGGKIEIGENPPEGAARELLEETGFIGNELILLEEYNDNSKIDFQDWLFLAQNCRKIAEQNLDPGEKIQVSFVSFEEFLEFARKPRFAIPRGLRHEMWEALLEPSAKEIFRKKLGL